MEEDTIRLCSDAVNLGPLILRAGIRDWKGISQREFSSVSGGLICRKQPILMTVNVTRASYYHSGRQLFKMENGV